MLIRITTLALVAIIAIVAIAACNPSSAGRGEPASVVGREFLSTEATENGAARPLVEGSRIRMAFERVRLSMNAGCNTFNGEYTITAGQLIVDQMASTEMACPQPLMDQDQWLAQFLAKKPLVRLAGNDLSLEADGTVIWLLDREVAVPDLALVGSSWGLESIARGDTVSSVAGTPPELQFGADGRVTFTTGCNDGFATYKLNAQTVQLSGIGTTKRACVDEMADVEQAVLAVLGSSAVAFHIDGSLLKLTAGGLRLEYRSGPSR